MAGLALSGLASGVDTGSIVDQLMALERQSTTRLGYRRAAVAAQQTGLTEVASKLAALRDASAALASGGTWAQTQATESSDPARVAVVRTGGAGIGGHSVQVDRLASSMQRGYAFDGSAGGTLTLAYASGDDRRSIDVTVNAGATLQQVADAINAKGAGPVVAAVVKDSGGDERLVLSSRKTGSESDFTVAGAGVLSEDAAYRTPDVSALDASYRLDGGAARTSQTNVLESAIPGLRITLKGVTSAPATVSVGEPALDRDAVKAKVEAFVKAYNAVVDTTRGKLGEKPVASPRSDFQAGYGQLFGDTGLQSMLSGLRAEMTKRLGGAGVDDLADIGVTMPRGTGGAISEDGRAGRLVLDAGKLTAALDADWTQVQSFLGDFAEDVKGFVAGQTGGAGVIDARLKNAGRSLDRIADQVERTNERLELREKRLRSQFAAMELALQNAQTQQSWLSGQIAGLQAQTR